MTLDQHRAPRTERLLLKLAYALETRASRHRLTRRDLIAARRVVVWQFSTDDHLRVLLEDLLAAGVATAARLPDAASLERIRAAEWMEPLAATGLLELELARSFRRDAAPPDFAIALVSDRALRSRFGLARALAVGAGRKAIVNGRSEIWRADARSLASRIVSAPLLRRLLPWRDRREAGAIERAWAELDSARESVAEAILLESPVPVLVDAASGDVWKRLPDFDAATLHLYSDDYYGAPYPPAYPDWRGALASYQDHFARNMRAVGLDPSALRSDAPRVLDVGCGTGALAAMFAAAGARAEGIDPSSEAIDQARAAFPELPFAAETLADRVARMEDGEAFDLLLLAHVVEHVADADALLALARQALRAGGALYIETPLASREALRLRPAWHRQRDHCREYSERGLIALVERAGFVVEARADGLAFDPPVPHQFLLARSPA